MPSNKRGRPTQPHNDRLKRPGLQERRIAETRRRNLGFSWFLSQEKAFLRFWPKQAQLQCNSFVLRWATQGTCAQKHRRALGTAMNSTSCAHVAQSNDKSSTWSSFELNWSVAWQLILQNNRATLLRKHVLEPQLITMQCFLSLFARSRLSPTGLSPRANDFLSISSASQRAARRLYGFASKLESRRDRMYVWNGRPINQRVWADVGTLDKYMEIPSRTSHPVK